MQSEICRKIELQKLFAMTDFRQFLTDDGMHENEVDLQVKALLGKIDGWNVPFSFYGWFTRCEIEYFEVDVEAFSFTEEELQQRYQKTPK